MRKIFTFTLIGCLVIVSAAGCAREKKPEPRDTSVLEKLPFVYKMTVQQGNIITEDMVDSLKPGMTKRQVNFLLGTPLLSDFFHQNRWDYTYTIKRGHKPMEQRNLTLYFQDDLLTHIEGDIHPDPNRTTSREPQEISVAVPDYQQREGLLTKSLEAIGLEPKK